MKKCFTVGIILLFIGTAIAPLNVQSASYAYPLNSNTHSVRENGTDFTVNASGPSCWLVVKLTFPTQTYISIFGNETSSYNYSKYGYSILMCSRENFQDWTVFCYTEFKWSDPEVYCHIGTLNWSIAHDNSQYFPDWGDGHSHIVLPRWLNGPWYVIFISSATNESFSLTIHANQSGSIAVERGDKVFALDRDNFLGGFNIGWRRGVCMVNTQKTLEIKHQFVGVFGAVSLFTGFYLLRCQMPNGTSQRLFNYNFLGGNWVNYIVNSSLLVFGPSGTWQFHATMLDIALLKYYPRVYLAGADVILPS
ncbi:MAG TPA: hypothetical protein VMT57_03910 [Candidatus Thermoplasmatota archaeon]|nr:hypothetical protein [Candidatus Thermoplasmatota archaeon]